MVKVGDKVRGFKFGEKIDDGSENTFAIEKATGLNYHPSMDLYVGEEGEVSEVKEETFVVKFKKFLSLSDYDYWTYPIADYLEITRNEILSELGI